MPDEHDCHPFDPEKVMRGRTRKETFAGLLTVIRERAARAGSQWESDALEDARRVIEDLKNKERS